ncbi:MAG: hypothetical protein ABIH28_03860 [archaeon]
MENKSFNNKSQTAIEFIILVSFVLFFFSIFFMVIGGNISDKMNERRNLLVKDIAFTVQDEINLASKSSEGYVREFDLPEKVGEKDYIPNIVEDMIYVKTSDGKSAIALPIPKITGQILIGRNTIKKEDGEIKLNS